MGSVHCYFCGGAKCKFENYDNWLDNKNSHNAIVGLYSNWITDHILATARPSTRIIEQYDIIDQFHENNIGAIINLQQPGEHKECGDGLINDEFSYCPDDFMRANIFYYNFGWKDMTVPPLELVLNIVQVMCFTMSQNKKVAIHCHAGLGRTGLVIACYLVYTHKMDATEAVSQVRLHRPLSIQTTKQSNFIFDFENFTKSLRIVYDKSNPSLSTVLSRQRKYLHGVEVQALRYVPKILQITCERLNTWANNNKNNNNNNNNENNNYFDDTPVSYPLLLRDLNEEEKALLIKCKLEVDEGEWERTKNIDGVIAVQMLLDWLSLLSPRLLHEGIYEIVSNNNNNNNSNNNNNNNNNGKKQEKSIQGVLSLLSDPVLKSLSLLLPTLQNIAPILSPENQHTFYSSFAKVLIPFKSKTLEDDLPFAISFLKNAKI